MTGLLCYTCLHTTSSGTVFCRWYLQCFGVWLTDAVLQTLGVVSMIDRLGQIYSVTFKWSSIMCSGFPLCVAISLAISQILRRCPAQNTAGA